MKVARRLPAPTVTLVTNPLLIADATNLTVRAWFATREGDPQNVAALVSRWVHTAARRVEADGHVCAFDGPDAGASRHAMYPDYKAGRAAKADGLKEALKEVPRLVKAAGSPVMARPGAEADDILAQYAASGDTVVLLTSDKDALGLLVHANASVLQPASGGVDAWNLIDASQLETLTSVPASCWALYAALKGDKSDNIPGVTGIQATRAAKLALEFSTVDAFLDDLASGGTRIIASLGKGAGGKLAANAEQVEAELLLSVELASPMPLGDLPGREAICKETARLAPVPRTISAPARSDETTRAQSPF